RPAGPPGPGRPGDEGWDEALSGGDGPPRFFLCGEVPRGNDLAARRMVRTERQRTFTMERSDLNLQFSVFEGGAARISRVVLFGPLRAAPQAPHRPTPSLLILCRDASGCPPPWITQSAVTDQEVERLVRLLRSAGFPRRVPRIVAHKGRLD